MSAGANPRALAAQALAEVVAGKSLRAVQSATAARLDDARDRALFTALLHEGARWWLRFDVALDAMLERPLRERDADIRALLVLGLVQVEILRLSDYAAVSATVEAARALRKPSFAGLVNALLRRWLREREACNARLDRDAATATAHPPWLIASLQSDWPQEAAAILAANNRAAPLWLRINRRRVTPAGFAAQLAEAGVACRAPDDAPDALLLESSLDVTGLPGYAQGAFAVQDGAAQQAAALLDLRAGQRVLDACAAPGGKSAHILESADVRLTALDADARRLPRLRENLQRLGLAADVRAGDAATPRDWWDGVAFDRILLDAPCSATGIIRRQPDVKLHRRADDISALCVTQERLLDALWPLLGRGGRLVYATCSVLADENARQVDAFLGRHADARGVQPTLPWHAAGAGVQNLPGESGMDGFFYALVEKHN
ncbi:MAG: 16S rRNA (cytosine(967)-C(5))-methyltransferase RsmB [Proteobacteria bacterium]|nr:16S rRNA (cytosine(967)-C(5))-methyltransferase RsmB [Pseudomonadota bacterium]